MDELASLVITKLHVRSGVGTFALVACEHDPYYGTPDTKIPTVVVRTVTHSSGELNYEVAYINVASEAHRQLREEDALPEWTFITFRRIDVASDFVQGFVRRHKHEWLAFYIDLYNASDVDALFQVDGGGKVHAPHEGVASYLKFHENGNRVARHPTPDANGMARAMRMLTPHLVWGVAP